MRTKFVLFSFSGLMAAVAGTAANAHEGAAAVHFATQPDHSGIVALTLLGLVAFGFMVWRDLRKTDRPG